MTAIGKIVLLTVRRGGRVGFHAGKHRAGQQAEEGRTVGESLLLREEQVWRVSRLRMAS